MAFEFAKHESAICSNEISKIIGEYLSDLANNINFNYTNINEAFFKSEKGSFSDLKIIRINSDLNKTLAHATVNDPISKVYQSTLSFHKNIVELNDKCLENKKTEINDIIKDFGNLKEKYYKNLEKGRYNNTITGHYLILETINSENGIEKNIEFTFDKGDLLIYSYSETKKDKNKNIIYYKFVNFTDDGKEVLNCTENYVLNNQRLEIRRNSEGEITELTEETGKKAYAFYTDVPLFIIKKDFKGEIIDYREFRYDLLERVTHAKFIKKNSYYEIENIYENDYIISNYKNFNGQVYWKRIYNNKIKRHSAEQIFDNNGKLIREEKYVYNKYGDLTFRINRDANGEILSAKEIKYNEHNSPFLIINRGKNGLIKTKIKIDVA